MKNPKVSIVCISYNHEKFIKETIDSFLSQKADFEYEIIIADDASHDNTQAIISSYAKKHDNIVPVLRLENVGVQSNLLDAMAIAKGDYIALCEGDDFWTDPLKLQLQADFLDTHNDISVSFHQVEVFFDGDHNKKRYSPVNSDYSKSMNVSIADLLRSNFIPTNSVMYRRQDNYNSLNKKVMPLDWYLHAYHAKFGKIHYMHRLMAKNRRHEGGVWWEAEEDSNAIWIKYKKGWIQLFKELLMLFGHSDDYRKIIKSNFLNFINILFQNQTAEEFKSLSLSIVKYDVLSSVFVEILLDKVVELYDGTQKLSDHSNEQAKIIDHYVRFSQKLEIENKHLETENKHLEIENKHLAAHPLKRLARAAKKRVGHMVKSVGKKKG